MRIQLKMFVVLSIVSLYSCVIFPVGAAPLSPPVMYQQGKLSVALVKMPIRAALQKIAAKADISIQLDPEISGTLSARFKNLHLQVGLRRLLRNHNFSFVFVKTAKGERKLKSVKVFREGHHTSAKYEVLDGESASSTKKTTVKNSGSQGASGTTVEEEVQGRSIFAGAPAIVIPPVSAINPNSPAARAQVMAAIVKVQNKIEYLNRKSAAEERILQGKIDEQMRELTGQNSEPTLATLDPGNGDLQPADRPDTWRPPVRGRDPMRPLELIRGLEIQKDRKDQENTYRRMEAQKELQQLAAAYAQLSDPAEQQRENNDQVEKQQKLTRAAAALRAEAMRRKERAAQH